MQNYELLLVLPGTLSDNEVEPVVEKIKSQIEADGGSDIVIENNEKRRLAYPIKHIRYGYFFMIFFKAEPEAFMAMRRKLELLTEPLRILIQKYDSNKQASKKIEFGLAQQGSEERTYERKAPIRKVVEKKVIEPKTVELKEDELVEEEKEVYVPEVEEKVVEEKVVEEKIVIKKSEPVKTEEKIDMADIDKKLDEILDIDLSNV